MRPNGEDLATWLRRQLKDDEAAVEREIQTEIGNVLAVGVPITREEFLAQSGGRWHSPLAELDARRRILDLHTGPHECPEWDQTVNESCTGYYGAEGCPTLRLLAVPQDHRPGYRDEWRPA
ncbi:DUF6221 family protein [Micromonospora sediminimaris]|uniref:Uncharacterized protein n=1 Tax=Micromonospora sediminimaris TaxID=547162 RepID=A0A9W5UX45_9ACTN|nr:DUF6221 family protein [Micromonospora sediminimaris]GIJ35010.1 hypothetical protein Vse01_41580 [Micromonospora sediminimaris]